MSFLDDAFDGGFVDRLKETLQDTGWFFAAPVATALDLARAGISEDVTVGGSLVQGFQRGTQLFFGDENEQSTDADNEDNLLSSPLDKAMDGLEWLYDNAIAQPLNTGLIVARRGIADVRGVEDNADPGDFGSAWAEADEAKGGYGKGTSIGREATYLYFGLFGNDQALTEDGRQILDEKSKLFDVVSGVQDFAARFFLDPTIVGGKAAKALRVAKVIHRIDSPEDITKLLSKQGDSLFAGFGKRHEAAMNFIAQPTKTGRDRSAAEIYAAFPGLRESNDGWGIANLMEGTVRSLRKQGAEGAEITHQVSLVSRAGMGDAVALKEISDKVSETKDALAALNSQRDELKTAADWLVRPNRIANPYGAGATRSVAEKYGLADDIATRGEDYFADPEFLALTNERLKAVSKDVRAAENEAARVERIGVAFKGDTSKIGVLSDRPLLAAVTGSTRGLEKRAAKEAGEPARLDFVFQSSVWNKGVRFALPHIYYGHKAVKLFGTTAAPRVIEFHDRNASLGLNNFLKHSNVSPEVRMQLVSDMAGARTEGQMRVITDKAVAYAQESLIDAYKAKNPHFNDETARIVKDELAKEMAWERKRLALQVRQFTTHKTQDGKRGDLRVDEETGLVSYHPLLETQLENRMILPDLREMEHILHKHSNWLTDMAAWAKGDRAPDQGRIKDIAGRVFDHRVKKSPGFGIRTANRVEALNTAGWRTEEFMKSALHGFTKAWKYAVLLRPAYPMRVLVDSDLRALAKLGPKAFAMHTAPRAFGFATMGSASRIRMHFAAGADDDALRALDTNIEKFEDTWRATNGDGPIQDDAYTDLLARKREIEKRLELYRTGGRKGRREAYGTFGEAGQRDIKTAAGVIRGAFADDYGKTQRWAHSSETTAALMGDTEKLALKELMSESWVHLEYNDVNHMSSWVHAVNAQLLQSKLGRKALEFQLKRGDNAEAAVRDLVQWVKRSPEGRDLMGRLQWTWADKEARAREIVGYVNHYLPTPGLRQKASERRLTQIDLESEIPNPPDRPPVHGTALAHATERGNLAAKMANDWFHRTMRWLADAPEDQLARHPMYAAVYEQEAKRRAEFLLADPRIETVTGADIKKLVQDQAHKKASQAIRQYMFDVASHSDLSHALRFMSPFIAAWEDTVRKWSRIAMDKPEFVGRAYLAWNMPNDLGLVVDKDGKPVDQDDFSDETYMLVRWPSWVPKVGGKNLGLPLVDVAEGTQFRIPKQVVNIVLQGGLQPGFGPLTAYPVGKLQVAQPELNDVARFINPYGPPEGVWDAVAPSTLKRVEELMNNQSRAHLYDTERMFMQMQHEYRVDPEKFDGKAPSWEDAAERARGVGVLKVINNFANPFPAIFDSPYKFYIDAYRDLKRQENDPNLGHERGWADEQFIKGYGESFFPLVQSMSKNNAGLGSSAEAVDASKRYKSLISKYGMEAGEPNATLIRLIVGPEGEGDFNQSAHRWQESREISPGSGVNYRSVANSQEAAADADADLGWYKFRQFQNTIDGLANERGLRTYREDEELVAARKQFIENLKSENDAWRVDFEQQDPQKFTRDLEQLSEVSTSGRFGPMRTDMAGVREYLALREALRSQLAEFEITPGSQDAIPFKQEFTEAVMDLVSRNTQFAEWAFYPYLERDPLLEQSTNPPASSAGAGGSWGF